MAESGGRRFTPRALREMTITYSRADLLAVGLIAAVVAGWAAFAGRSFSVLALLACEVSFITFYLTGSLLAAWKGLTSGILFDVPLRLLVGYGIVNTSLLALALISPFGIVVNFSVVAAGVLLASFAAKERKLIPGNPASLWTVAICLVATTLWCQDSIDPIVERDNVVVFKPWVDGFYHAVHIRIFADSHGAASIEDFRMAGVPARLYHYGAYLLPAFVKQLSDIHSYTAFAGILAPVGVLFTGFAAYALFGTLWGPWPGLAAAATLLLLPDGAQQGMHNPFLSYHWLTQISPSATYGLALLGVAWLFVLQGCTRGSRLQLLAGWFVAAVLVAYKLHYVVASALLLLLVPALFFRKVGAATGIGPRQRLLWVAGACAFYVAALVLGQRVPGVPLIRFDGSAHGEILHLMQTFHFPGTLRDYLTEHTGRLAPWTKNLALGIPYISFAILGLFIPLLVALVVVVRKRMPLVHVAFPVLLIVNFLAMFFGLALDFDSSTPDELSHRPLMVVYFFVVCWVGGALGLLAVESRHLRRFARPALVGLSALLMIVPALLGSGVQLMWVMPKISPVRLPTSLLTVADYMRDNGTQQDIFQDSQYDRIYALAALSERKTFVSHTMTRMAFRSDMVATRSAAIDRLMSLSQPALVVGTARAYGIRWFVLQRGNKVNWPAELADKTAFESGPFRVYDFE